MMKYIALIFGCLMLAGCASIMGPHEKVAIFAHTDVAWADSTMALQRALKFCRQEEVDRVVFIGDVTRDGAKNQYEVFEQVWAKAFKGVTPPERILVEKEYFIGSTRFHAYGRLSLTDLVCARSQDGRSVYAGSMHGFDYSSLFEPAGDRLKAAIGKSAQGLLVLVESERLVIRRMDFSSKRVEDLGEPWLANKEGLVTAEEDRAPAFWSDTELLVVKGYDSKGLPIYTLRWPPVLRKFTGTRAYYYEVELPNGKVKNVVSSGFFLPESRDRNAVKLVVSERELEGHAPRFKVRPVSSLGKIGEAIVQG